MTIDCLNCGGETTHKVWESLLLFEAGMPPKYIGCANCGGDGIMSHECECGWTFVGGSKKEELLARIEHMENTHSMTPDTDQFSGDNLELIEIVHKALEEINTSSMDGWYTSQIERMRDDANEIINWEGLDD